MRPDVRVPLFVSVFGLLTGVPAFAQDSPPPPLPLKSVSFPEFHQATLANGAPIIVVENHEQPMITVNLRIKSGSAVDPEGKEGLAAMVANLLDKGTSSLDATEIAEAIDFIGASLGASAGDDWTSVTVTSTTDHLDEALAILADVLMDPTFPEQELEIERNRTLSALKVELSQPDAIASRYFLQGVYGAHPYGNLMTQASVQAITRDDLVQFHRTHYRPNNALFVVAGDVTPDDIRQRLERHFARWESGRAPAIALAGAPERTSRKIHFFHKPGSVQAVVRIGHLMSPATDPDWIALDVAVRVLGGSSTAWLFEVLRQEKGYTYGAYASAAKRVDRGYFQAWAEVRNEVADSALAEMFALLERIREEPVPPEDLNLAKNSITGSFPRQIETPQQVAGQIATTRLRGLPDDYLETYRDRVAAVEAADVQRVAREHFRPDEALVVVVGDATEIYDKVAPFGEIELFDVEGNAITLADLEVRAAEMTFDPSIIGSVTLVYSLVFNGNPVGELTTEVSRETRDGEEVIVSRTSGGAMTMTLEQEVVFHAETFTGVTSTASQEMGGRGLSIDVALNEGVLSGSVTDLSGEVREIESEVVEGTLLPGMDDYVVWLADLERGAQFSVPAFSAIAGSAYTLSVKVVEETTVNVPAGEFDAYRLEVSGQPQGPRTLLARKAAPHIILKQEPSGQPITIELKEMR